MCGSSGIIFSHCLIFSQGGTRLFRRGGFYHINYTEEILSFNLLSRVWRAENVAPHDFPMKRDFHTGQYIDGKFYVFGGKSEHHNECMSAYFAILVHNYCFPKT